MLTSYLNLLGNGDLSSLLLAEAIDTTDARSILAAYRRYRSAAEQDTLRPLNEAKLLVVGNEAVGKTSLIRYLAENVPRNPSEPKIPGTAIHEQIDTRAWLASEVGVTLNILGLRRAGDHARHASFLPDRTQSLPAGLQPVCDDYTKVVQKPQQRPLLVAVRYDGVPAAGFRACLFAQPFEFRRARTCCSRAIFATALFTRSLG